MRKTWNPARVIDQGENPRSYLIKTGTGTQLRRNRIHLRPNNASNNLADNLSSCIPQGSMTTQSSSANPQELTTAGNPIMEAEEGPRKSHAGRVIKTQSLTLALVVIISMMHEH